MMNIDWKGYKAQYKEIMGAKEFVVEDRIKEAYEAGVHLEISIPIYISTVTEIHTFFCCPQFLSSLSREIPCHLFKVNSSYQFLGRSLVDSTSMALTKGVVSLYMDNVFME